MISNANSKLIRSLSRKKNRDQQKLFVVEGEKMVLELLEGMAEVVPQVQEIFATGEWITGNNHLIRGAGTKATEATDQELRKVSNLVTPQKVLALVHIPDVSFSVDEVQSGPVLGFEAVRDPGNLGTIIRTADWFGIRNILCTPDSVDLYNPKVVQATMGAMVRVKVNYLDLESLLKDPAMQNKPTYGTFPEGENIYETTLEENPMILFGNESKGLSPRFDPLIRSRLTIPSFTGDQSGSESLNLASSVAVVCSEVRRRE